MIAIQMIKVLIWSLHIGSLHGILMHNIDLIESINMAYLPKYSPERILGKLISNIRLFNNKWEGIDKDQVGDVEVVSIKNVYIKILKFLGRCGATPEQPIMLHIIRTPNGFADLLLKIKMR